MSQDPLTLLLWAWIAMAGWMAVLWLVELVRRNASLADVGWCVGLAAVSGCLDRCTLDQVRIGFAW